MFKVAIAGAGGRMGRMLIEAALASPDCRIAAALEVPSSPLLGQDVGSFAGRPVGVAISACPW